MYIKPNQRLDVMLSTTGGVLGTGVNAPDSTNAITEGEYTYICPAGKIAFLWRIDVKIAEDVGNVDLTKYGSDVLTDGIIITCKDVNDNIYNHFTVQPLTRIDDWIYLLGPDLPTTDLAVVALRWTLTKGSPMIRLDPGEYFSVELQEDTAGLAEQRFHLQGYLQNV